MVDFVSFVKTTDAKMEWESTRVQNLIRYGPSGRYLARFRVGGKLVRQSLETSIFPVAELRLKVKITTHRKVHEARGAFSSGKMTVGDAVQILEEKIEANTDLKPKTKGYYVMLLGFIQRSWPGLAHEDAKGVSERDCEIWLARYRKSYAPSVVNGSIGLLRSVFCEALEVGARFGNPAAELKRVKARAKRLKLPSRDEFLKFVHEIDAAGSRDSKNCADLVRVLAYSGMRIGESKHITWADVDLVKGKLHVRGDPDTGTKNSETRVVPLTPELHLDTRETAR